MKYLTSYYWQQEEKSLTSLVLQHLVYRRRKVPVLFACLCSVEEEWGNSYFAEQLVSWFQNKGRKLLVANGDNEKKIIAQLHTVIGQIDEELKENGKYNHDDSKSFVSVAGVLCMADYYLLFYRGNQKVYLLNYRFGQANCKQISQSGSEQLQIISGRMEKNIGLLLATNDWGRGITEEQIKECLAVKTLTGKNQEEKTLTRKVLSPMPTGERRLQELGQVSVQNGGRNMGAVLLVTE